MTTRAVCLGLCTAYAAAVSELVIDAPARIELGAAGSEAPAVILAEAGASGTALRVEGFLKAEVMEVGNLNVGDELQSLSSRTDVLLSRMDALES